MFASTLASTLLLCAAGALAQTPAGTTPSTDKNLPVKFGQVHLTPGEELPYARTSNPCTLTCPCPPLICSQPATFLTCSFLYSPTVVQTRPQLRNANAGSSGPFIVAMLDQDLPAFIFPSNATLVSGDGPGRTVRLHWFQTNVTAGGPDCQLNLDPSPSSVYATYEGPQPPKGDIAHKYVLYQFSQPPGFVVPKDLANGTFLDTSTDARNNFSIAAVTSQQGVVLLGANYMRVQNPNNTCAPTVPTNCTSSGSACPSGVATPTGSLTKPGGSGATYTPVRVNGGGRIVVAVPALVFGIVAAFLL